MKTVLIRVIRAFKMMMALLAQFFGANVRFVCGKQIQILLKTHPL